MSNAVVLRKLWRLAFITSPLLGLFGARPVFTLDSFNTARLLFGLSSITVIAFIFFCLNIWLWQIAARHKQFKTKLRYVVSMVLALSVALCLYKLVLDPIMFTHFPPPAPPGEMSFRKPPPLPLLPMLQAAAINLIILTLIDLSYLKHSKAEIALENAKLRMANLEARHSALLEQLHPHFLFNSLSTLSSLIRRDAASAEAYLLKLSELLRSAMSSDQMQQVTIDRELELTKHYLDMQQVRFKDALQYAIHIPAGIRLSSKVPVYSIRLLVENAIKHNMMTHESPLHIDISCDSHKKTITVCNNLQIRTNDVERQGLGLQNLATRYDMISGKPIDIKQDESSFCVTIYYQDHESVNH